MCVSSAGTKYEDKVAFLDCFLNKHWILSESLQGKKADNTSLFMRDKQYFNIVNSQHVHYYTSHP